MYICQGEYVFKNNTASESFGMFTHWNLLMLTQAFLTHFFPASAASDFQQCLRRKESLSQHLPTPLLFNLQ